MLAWIITSGISVASVLLIRRIFKGKISLRLQYALWLLVLIRLLTPVNMIQSDLSILNFIPQAQEAGRPWGQSNVAGDKAFDMSESPWQNIVQGELPEGAQFSMQAPQTTGRSDGMLPNTPGSRKSAAQETGLWKIILTGIWMLGMAVTGAVIVGVNLTFSHRLRRARRAMESGEADFPRREKRLPVYYVSGLPSPCLFGVIGPAIYLPEDVTREQLPYVLAHEESHYRMGDHIWSLLRSLCLVLHWYHPLVWLAAWVSRQDSELACDERTIRRLGEESRGAYGRVLVDVTAERGRRADFLCCATAMNAGGKNLRERVQMIARRPRTLAATGVILAVLMLGIFCVACTGVREEDSVPEDSQTMDSPAPEEGREPQPNETEQDATDPTVDHVRSDNAYYRVIKDTTIDDPYFTMEVPEMYVGQVAYGILLGENDAGEKYLKHLTLFYLPAFSQLVEGEPEYGWHELSDGGCLCYCFWNGFSEWGEEGLEEMVLTTGTWDINEMEYWFAYYSAGLEERFAQVNQSGTGAYLWTRPSDVQNVRNAEKYGEYMDELESCWESFSVKSFPYEELEGCPGEMPRWRQDFEKAEEIFSWFTSMGQIPMGADYREDVFGNASYGVVEVPGISTMEDLRAYVNRYFAPEITEALLSGSKPDLDDKKQSPLFVEGDGELLALAGWVGLYHYKDAERQYVVYFEQNPEGRRTARINMLCQSSWYLLSDDFLPTAVLTYTMEEQEDGSWRVVGDYELPLSLTLAQANEENTP